MDLLHPCIACNLVFFNSAIGPHKLLLLFFTVFVSFNELPQQLELLAHLLCWCWSSGGCCYNIWWGSLSVLRTPGKRVKFPGFRGNIRQSTTTLTPLTAEVNNIDNLVKMHCCTGKRVPCIHAETTWHMLLTQHCNRCSPSSCHWTFLGSPMDAWSGCELVNLEARLTSLALWHTPWAIQVSLQFLRWKGPLSC